MPDWTDLIREHLAGLRFDPAREAEIVEELSGHLDMRYSELRADGASEAEARRIATAELNEPNVLAGLMHSTRQANVPPPVTPATPGGGILGNIWLDLRFALRMLAQTPGFTAVGVLTLALAIGGNTTLFSLLDAVLLRSLPYRNPDRLVEIWGRDADSSGARVPGPLLEALRQQATTLEAIAIHSPDQGELRTSEGPVRIVGRRVSANFFDVMGVRPFLGRTFLPEEDNPEAPAVMVVNYRFWQSRMGADPEGIGRTVDLAGRLFTVVGVMPSEFRTSFGLRSEEYWTPSVSEDVRQVELEAGYELTARLAPGVTIEEARREIEIIRAGVDLDGWGSDGLRLDMVRRIDEVVGNSAQGLRLLGLAVAVVLVIACANLALLTLARSDRRIAEFATRKAMGATRAHLVRLALVESLVLSAAGGVGGVLLSYGLHPSLVRLAPSGIPRIGEAAIDGRVFGVAVCLVVLTACAFGLAPALRLSRLSAMDAMKQGPGSVGHRSRFRAFLVVGQIAASVALLVLAGLIGQTFLTLLPSNPGFESRDRTVFPLSLFPVDLFDGPEERIRVSEELVRRVESLPGIAGTGLGTNVPFGSDDGFRNVRDLDGPDPTREYSADFRAVSANYFDLWQMPITRGRAFTPQDDRSAAGVAIVNETLARKLAPDGDVLGRRIEFRGTYEVVGVVADARSSGATTDVWDEFYIPFAQSNSLFFYLIVRSSIDSNSLDEMLRTEIRAAMPARPDDPYLEATAMEDLVHQALAGPRFSATLITAFAANGLLLAAIGVFGLMAYSVSQRRWEFGLRAALGADPWKLLGMVMRSAIALTAIGVSVGVATAVYLTRFVESQLYAVEPLDLPTFLAATALIVAVASLAAYIPARRASRTSPLVALRYE